MLIALNIRGPLGRNNFRCLFVLSPARFLAHSRHFFDCCVNFAGHMRPLELLSHCIVHEPRAGVSHQFWGVPVGKGGVMEGCLVSMFVQRFGMKQCKPTVENVTRAECPFPGCHLAAEGVLGLSKKIFHYRGCGPIRPWRRGSTCGRYSRGDGNSSNIIYVANDVVGFDGFFPLSFLLRDDRHDQ